MLFIFALGGSLAAAQEPSAPVTPTAGPTPPSASAKSKVPPAPIRQRRLVASQGMNDKLPLQRDPFANSQRMEDEYNRLNMSGKGGPSGPVLPPLRLQGYAGNVAMIVVDEKRRMVVRVGDTINLPSATRPIEVKVVEMVSAGVVLEVIATGQTLFLR